MDRLPHKCQLGKDDTWNDQELFDSRFNKGMMIADTIGIALQVFLLETEPVPKRDRVNASVHWLRSPHPKISKAFKPFIRPALLSK